MRRFVLAVLLLAVLPPTAAQAKRKPEPKLRVEGFSVNATFLDRGTEVTADDGTNACFQIAGADGAPPSLQAVVYVKATKIPKSAKTHATFRVPWDKASGVSPDDGVFDGPFKKGLFASRTDNLGGAYRGPTRKGEAYTYRMLPTGNPTSYYVSGVYSYRVSAKVAGRTITAKGRITIDCG